MASENTVGGPLLNFEGPRSTSGHTKDTDSTAATNSMSQSQYFASLSSSEVQLLLDEEVKQLSASWHASILFKVRVLPDKYTNVASIFERPLQEVDFCQYLNGGRKPTYRLYFDSEKYPPPKNNEMETDSDKYEPWINLKRDIQTVAHHSGSPVTAKGRAKKGDDSRVFICNFNNCRKSKAMDATSENPYKSSSLIDDDKANRRPDGRKKPRRVNVAESQHRCPMRFVIKWDEYGFYMYLDRNAGNSEHIGHPKRDGVSMPTRLLSESDKEETRHVVESTTNKAVGRNFLLRRLGKFINSAKIAYLTRSGKGTAATDDISEMLDTFKSSNEIAFTTISDVPMTELEDVDINHGKSSYHQDPEYQDETVTVSTTKDASGKVTTTEVNDLPELAPVDEFAKTERANRQLPKNNFLFISIAWILLPAFRFFKLCPEVIWSFECNSISDLPEQTERTILLYLDEVAYLCK